MPEATCQPGSSQGIRLRIRPPTHSPFNVFALKGIPKAYALQGMQGIRCPRQTRPTPSKAPRHTAYAPMLNQPNAVLASTYYLLWQNNIICLPLPNPFTASSANW